MTAAVTIPSDVAYTRLPGDYNIYIGRYTHTNGQPEYLKASELAERVTALEVAVSLEEKQAQLKEKLLEKNPLG